MAGATASPESSLETRSLAKETGAYTRLRQNLQYLYDPKTAALAGIRPSSIRTRALLRSLHHLAVFLFWRAVRWAKYAAIGSAVAALGSVAVAGSAVSGIGFLLAPPGILASVGIGTVWGLGRWGCRRYFGRALAKNKGNRAQAQRKEYSKEPGPGSMPW